MLESVDSSWSPWDDWTARLLNSGDTGQSPEVTVGDPWEFLLDLLHVVSCDVLAHDMSKRSERSCANHDFDRHVLTRPLLAPCADSGLNRMVA